LYYQFEIGKLVGLENIFETDPSRPRPAVPRPRP